MAETPWGPSQYETVRAPGVTAYSTAGHGGLHVSDAVLALWPPELSKYQTFAGHGWYEEDCDASIAILAMPHLFDDYAVWAAFKMSQNPHSGLRSATVEFFGTPTGVALMKRAMAWGAEQASLGRYYQSGGGTSGAVWNQRWKPFDSALPEISTQHDTLMGLPAMATRAELAEKYTDVCEVR